MKSEKRLELQDACRVCGAPSIFLFSGVLLGTSANYFECKSCGYVQTENPFWLDKAYTVAINDSDTGIVKRNQINTRLVVMTLLVMRRLRGRVVDFAGGYGLLVRMLRDLGIDALWRDQYCKNLVARGFEHRSEQADLVTAFEAFEHFVDPRKELAKMLDVAPTILISTQLIPTPAPSLSEWWYYGQEHGQHIGFFRRETLTYLAREFRCQLITDGKSVHLITRKKIKEGVWKLVMMGNHGVPLLARLTLRSRTWSDHLAMKNQRN